MDSCGLGGRAAGTVGPISFLPRRPHAPGARPARPALSVWAGFGAVSSWAMAVMVKKEVVAAVRMTFRFRFMVSNCLKIWFCYRGVIMGQGCTGKKWGVLPWRNAPMRLSLVQWRIGDVPRVMSQLQQGLKLPGVVWKGGNPRTASACMREACEFRGVDGGRGRLAFGSVKFLAPSKSIHVAILHFRGNRSTGSDRKVRRSETRKGHDTNLIQPDAWIERRVA